MVPQEKKRLLLFYVLKIIYFPAQSWEQEPVPGRVVVAARRTIKWPVLGGIY